MTEIQKLKTKYIDLLLNSPAAKDDILKNEEQLVSLTKQYAKKSKTPETDFLLGYFGLYFGQEYQITIDQTIKHIEDAHEAGNDDASILLASVYSGSFKFLWEDNAESVNAYDFIPIKAKFYKPSKGHLLTEKMALKGHPYAMYLYAYHQSEDIYSDEEEMEQEGYVRQCRDYRLAMEYVQKCIDVNFIGGYYARGLWLFYNNDAEHEKFHGELKTRAVKIWEEGLEKLDTKDLFAVPIYHDLCYALGYAYMYGEGCPVDEEKGHSYIKIAADAGHESALEYFENISDDTSQEKFDSPLKNSNNENKGKVPMVFSGDASLFQSSSDEPVNLKSPAAFLNKGSTGYKVEENGSGFYCIYDPKDEHSPHVRVRIHLPEEKNDAYKNYLDESQEKQQELMEKLLEPLDRLPGLGNIKEEVRDIVNYTFVKMKREELGLKTKNAGAHMLFLGNPGTGKTIVARLLGNIFYQIGMLNKGHVVEADASVLTGEFVGWTAQKTSMVCHTSLDGILFVDEAYALTDEYGYGGGNFGAEAISTFLKFMEDFSDNFVLIAAGYKDKMEEFVRSNPGLRSRFPLAINYIDYKPADMVKIYKYFAEEFDYQLNEEAENKLLIHLKSIKGNDLDRFANARGVRNLFDSTIKRQSRRLIREGVLNREVMMEIIADDIPSDKTIMDGNISYMPNAKKDK